MRACMSDGDSLGASRLGFLMGGESVVLVARDVLGEDSEPAVLFDLEFGFDTPADELSTLVLLGWLSLARTLTPS